MFEQLKQLHTLKNYWLVLFLFLQLLQCGKKEFV